MGACGERQRLSTVISRVQGRRTAINSDLCAADREVNSGHNMKSSVVPGE